MALRNHSIPVNYFDARDTLEGRDNRKVAHNTLLWTDPGLVNGPVYLMLHSTDIATFREDGSVTLNTGGWDSVTTRDRMNHVLRPGGWGVGTERGEMVLYNWETGDSFPFEDGDRVYVVPQANAPEGVDVRAIY